MSNIDLINKLKKDGTLAREEFIALLSTWTGEDREFARNTARKIADEQFGKKIYIRGLIEFTSYCRNDCYYCGLRKSNLVAQRYRLTKNEILDCCKTGYDLGFRTFVLQGGDDMAFTDDKLSDIINSIKSFHPDCAITLSLGEKERSSYQKLFDAGADRYLLRHETADSSHYSSLHPSSMSLEHRKKCLYELKDIGFQTGCGFMVGSPYQTTGNIADDLLFIKDLEPQMVGIGPFIPHCDTPFKNEPAGSFELTLLLLSIIRIMMKNVLLPATTALGTVDPRGRELGILAGANVVMPNLSPVAVRKKYSLYDNKICTGEEAAECRACLEKRVNSAGYEIVTGRGDWMESENN
ncbi:MAG: [FeFe] hydrogenase H-cluster radical SAM maturase HydE [Saccharofermentanales bacterium]